MLVRNIFIFLYTSTSKILFLIPPSAALVQELFWAFLFFIVNHLNPPPHPPLHFRGASTKKTIYKCFLKSHNSTESEKAATLVACGLHQTGSGKGKRSMTWGTKQLVNLCRRSKYVLVSR